MATIIHLGMVNVLPYPFNHINLIMSLFFLLIIFTSKKEIFWLAFFSSFFLELYSGLSFGIIIISSLIALIIFYWFLFNIFTHRSFYMIFLASALGMVIYRFVFIGFLFLYNVFFEQSGDVNTFLVLKDIFLEVIFTSIFILIFYVLLTFLIKKLRPDYVKKNLYG